MGVASNGGRVVKVQVSSLKATLLFALAFSGVAHGGGPRPPLRPPVEAIPTDAAQLRDAGRRARPEDVRCLQRPRRGRADGVVLRRPRVLPRQRRVARFPAGEGGFTSVFANNKDIRRDLVDGSLEVYPIKGFGAIEIGAHRFCHTEDGKEDCGTFRFLQIWRFKDGAWKVSRDVSYGTSPDAQLVGGTRASGWRVLAGAAGGPGA